VPLSAWQNFYVIIGSSAGALTGLQFVVMTLIAQTRLAAQDSSGIRAFGTPTVIHFCSALFIGAIMTIPWASATGLAITLLVAGAAGVVYSLMVIWHARRAKYNPDLEDWVWYTGLPITGHATLLAVAFLLWWHVPAALYVLAADSLVFLLLGLHNAWDTITYVVVQHANRSHKTDREY
jgi:hypothetical protein